MKKVILIVLVVLGAVGGFVAYKLMQAGKDTENITKLQNKELTAAEVEAGLTKSDGDFASTKAAMDSLDKLPEERQVELLKTSLADQNSATSLGAVIKLRELHLKGNEAAGKALDSALEMANIDPDAKITIGEHFGEMALSKVKDEDRFSELKKLSEDPRFGTRVFAHRKLGELGTPEALELAKTMLEKDQQLKDRVELLNSLDEDEDEEEDYE